MFKYALKRNTFGQHSAYSHTIEAINGSILCFEYSVFIHFTRASALVKVAVTPAKHSSSLVCLTCALHRSEKLTSQ